MRTFKTDTNVILHFIKEETPSRYGDIIIVVAKDNELYESVNSRKFESIDEAVEYYGDLVDEVGHTWEEI